MSPIPFRTIRTRISHKKSRRCCPWWPLLSIAVLGMVCIWYIHKGYRSHYDADCDTADGDEEVPMELELRNYKNFKREPNLVHIVQVIRPTTWCELKQSFNVCLATQATVDRVFTIGQVAENWQGPISLAILLNQEHELKILQDFINHMRFCHYRFRTTVSITIVVSKELKMELHGDGNRKQSFINLKNDFDSDDLLRSGKLKCEDDKSVAELLQHQLRLFSSLSPTSAWKPYPQNHLRNIASSHCDTDWVYVTDVDLIPKNNSASELQAFYESDEAQTCDKCAFVIPTFGILQNCTQFPKTKLELLRMVNASLAEPFHQHSWEPAQRETNYPKWAATYLEEEPVHISHKVIHNFTSYLVFHNRLNFYEPFYIAPNSIPYYDTRFVGYGFTRSSQTFEAIVAGWKFYVLTPVYSLHFGMQAKSDWKRVRASPRALQTRKNKPVYHLFTKTIWMKYRHLRISANREKL